MGRAPTEFRAESMRKSIIGLATLSIVAFSACSNNVSMNEDVHVGANTPGDGGAATLNGDIFVESGTVRTNADISTVNGNIRVAERAQVQSLRAVNGSIHVAEEASAQDVESVNGRVELGPRSTIAGNVKLVNGEVTLAPGSSVHGNIKTVNGEIRAEGATIDGDVSNYLGGMLITDESVVKGGITVHKPEEMSEVKPPRIVIGPGSKVLGRMKFEHPVVLYVHESAEVGPIDGAEPIRFSGALPESS
jgi:hypothetical protein